MLYPARAQVKHLISMLVSSETRQPLHFLYKKYNRKLHMSSLGLALVLLITLVPSTSSCTEREKDNLLQFLVGLSQDGVLASSWQDGKDCCKWDGITCSSDRTVTDVSLASKGLEGPIPSGGQFNTFQNSSFDGNPKLCGSMFIHKCGSSSTPQVSTKQRNKKAIFAIAFGVFFGGIAILLLLGRLLVSIWLNGFKAKNRRENNGDVEATSFNSSSEQTLVVMRMPQGKGEESKLKFTDILKATDNFDKENIIGKRTETTLNTDIIEKRLDLFSESGKRTDVRSRKLRQL